MVELRLPRVGETTETTATGTEAQIRTLGGTTVHSLRLGLHRLTTTPTTGQQTADHVAATTTTTTLTAHARHASGKPTGLSS